MDSSSVKVKKTPSHYRTVPFHGVRAVSGISSLIVVSILIYFCIELKDEGFKIPWSFLIVLAAAGFTFIALILTLCIHSCSRLSPLFNLILNIPLMIGWLVSLGLLAWNLYGTLSHSCSVAKWGNNDGVNVCQEYKTMFAFVVFGTIAQIAVIIVDIRARMAQNRSGRYANLRDSTSSVKLEQYNTARPTLAAAHAEQNESLHDTTSQYRDEPGWRPGQRTQTIPTNGYDQGDIAGRDGQREVRANDYYYQPYGQGQQTGYSSTYGQSQQTGYDSTYGQHNQFSQRY